jgi:fructose-1,6-bisphosphatase/inositol monophosphatase family enzyme
VRAAARLARLGCDAYAYAMVAAGTMDLVIEAGLKSWDIEAAIPVIAGAGGLTTDWRGEPVGQTAARSPSPATAPASTRRWSRSGGRRT